MPKVEAPDGSGCDIWVFGSGVGLGLVPEVDGVGDQCGLLVAGDVLGAELGGETGGGTGAGGAAGGAAGEAVLAGVIGELAGSRGCNLGTVVQLY